MAINHAPIGATEYSPYMLNMGFHPSILPDALQPITALLPEGPILIAEHFKRLQYIRDQAHSALKTALAQQRVQANRHRADFKFNVCDWVLFIPHSTQRASFNLRDSLSPLAQGPFRIQAKLNDVTYQLKFPVGCLINPSFHVNRLIPYRWATTGTEVFPDYFDPDTMIDPDEFLTQNDTLNDDTSSVSTDRFLTVNDALQDEPEVVASAPPRPPTPPVPLTTHSLPSPSMEWPDDDEPVPLTALSNHKHRHVRFHFPPSIIPDSLLSGEPPDSFTLEDVKLDPKIFQRARRELQFKPSADMFASYKHHQLPRYYSRMADTKAAGIDAFQHNWNLEPTPYVNPPWTLIPKVLRKIIHDRVRVMMVVPHWPSADWFPLFYRLTEKSIRLTEPCYLDDNGRLRPAPSWATTIAIVNGNREHTVRSYVTES